MGFHARFSLILVPYSQLLIKAHEFPYSYLERNKDSQKRLQKKYFVYFKKKKTKDISIQNLNFKGTDFYPLWNGNF